VRPKECKVEKQHDNDDELHVGKRQQRETENEAVKMEEKVKRAK
jgi:hypothetical protein